MAARLQSPQRPSEVVRLRDLVEKQHRQLRLLRDEADHPGGRRRGGELSCHLRQAAAHGRCRWPAARRRQRAAVHHGHDPGHGPAGGLARAPARDPGAPPFAGTCRLRAAQRARPAERRLRAVPAPCRRGARRRSSAPWPSSRPASRSSRCSSPTTATSPPCASSGWRSSISRSTVDEAAPAPEPRWAAYFQVTLELSMRRWGVRQVVLL